MNNLVLNKRTSVSHRLLMRLVLGILVSAAALVIVAWRINWVELGGVLSRVAWVWLPILGLVYLISFPIRGFRWQLMLHEITPITLPRSMAIISIGYCANNLLPARLGEFIRAAILAKAEKVSKVTAITSIGVERIFDGLSLVFIFALTSIVGSYGGRFQPEAQSLIRYVGIVAGAFFISLAGIFTLARIRPDWVKCLAGAVAQRLPDRPAAHIYNLVDGVLSAISFLRFDMRLLLILLLSIVIWAVEGFMFLVGMTAIGVPADPLVAYFTLAIVNFGILIPSAPGYVGIFQGCTVIAFGAIGHTIEIALGYSILVHSMQFLPITIVGLLAMMRFGWSFGILEHAVEGSSKDELSAKETVSEREESSCT